MSDKTVIRREFLVLGAAAAAMGRNSMAADGSVDRKIKTVCVLGASGRVGNLVVRWLLASGLRVVAVLAQCRQARPDHNDLFGHRPHRRAARGCELGRAGCGTRGPVFGSLRQSPRRRRLAQLNGCRWADADIGQPDGGRSAKPSTPISSRTSSRQRPGFPCLAAVAPTSGSTADWQISQPRAWRS